MNALDLHGDMIDSVSFIIIFIFAEIKGNSLHRKKKKDSAILIDSVSVM